MLLAVAAILAAAGSVPSAIDRSTLISRGIAPERAVVAFATSSERVRQFALRSVGAARTQQARAHRLYAAVLELKHHGRIRGDAVNAPKSRLPRTGVEVLLQALGDGEPMPAGCYELTSAYIAAARSIGIDAYGLDAIDPSGHGQIGHVVAAVADIEGVRPWVFDLQNESSGRRTGFRRLSDLELAAHHYNHWSVAAQLRGESARALRAIDDALLLAPWHPGFLNNRSVVLTSLGELDSAYAEISHAIHRQPNSALYRYQWGLLELERASPLAAVRALKSALAIRPDYPRARVELGWALLLSGDDSQGSDELRRSVAMPDSAPRARLLLAIRAMSRNRHEVVRSVLDEPLPPEARAELRRWLNGEGPRGEVGRLLSMLPTTRGEENASR
ncbi:MAG: hypothetical protein AAFZ38_00680 [Myxococcota bacterium]